MGGLSGSMKTWAKNTSPSPTFSFGPASSKIFCLRPSASIRSASRAAVDRMIGGGRRIRRRPWPSRRTAGASSSQTKSPRSTDFASVRRRASGRRRRRPSSIPRRASPAGRRASASAAARAAVLLGGGDLDDRRPLRRVAVERGAVDVVEEGEELVVVLLADRVVLVVVASGAADGQAEEHGAVGVDLVDDVADVDLFLDRAALAGRDVAAVEAGGDHLVEGRVGQQVAGELFDDELVERLVGVECVDDPVAIGPHLAEVVEVKAVGVAVPGGVEPEPGHVLAVPGRVEQAVDDLLIRGVEPLGRRRPGRRRRRPGWAGGR